MRFSLIIAVLLAVLLWETVWPSLRPGLIILLAGYVGTAILFLYRNATLARAATALRTEEPARGAVLAWFDKEDSFAKWAALLETGLRTIGFLVLGYGFWLATRSDAISLLLGVGYPAITYFGMDRRNRLRARQRLQTEKEAMATLLARGAHPENPLDY